MEINWTAVHTVYLDDEELNKIVDYYREHWWYEPECREMIRDMIIELEDYDYYAWNPEQTDEVVKEIKRRLEME